MRLKPETFALTSLLAAMTALASLSNDMYIPSMPEIATRLATTPAHVQLTLSAFLVGFAIGQIFYGPVSDQVGRKPVMAAGFLLFVGASLVCAFAQSIGVLIAARVVQSLGAAGPIILARTIVRDLYEGPRAARELSTMAGIMGLGPVFAPLLGGFLQIWFGWRASFLVTGTIGIVLGGLAIFILPETLPSKPAGGFSVRGILSSFGIVWRKPAFRAYAAILAAAYSGVFAFISASSFVLQEVYHLSPLQFSTAFMVSSLAMIAGTRIAGRHAHAADRTIGWAVALMAAGGSLQMLAGLFLPTSAAALIGSEMVYFLGLGTALPLLLAAAVAPFPERAGSAASLSGLIQMASACVVGTGIGFLLGSSAWPLMGATGLCGILSLVLYHLTRGARAGARA